MTSQESPPQRTQGTLRANLHGFVRRVFRVLSGGELFSSAALLLLAASPASAQMFESVGIRAQGMGGAFVAVADDSTATWWNPAGLASGSFFSAIVERRFATEPSEEGTLGMALSVPSLGVSYYRIRLAAASGTAGTAGENRQDGVAGTPSPTFVLNQFGVTVGQSVGNNVVLASTLKLIRADQLKGDLDIGMLVRVGSGRFGITVKHLHPPDLTTENIPIDLARQVRVGGAYAPAAQGAIGVVLAADADLTRLPTAQGDVKRAAGGAELWVRKRLGVRGGISAHTIGERRTAYSGGASVAVQKGTFLDAQVTRGDDEAKRGWGVDLRLTF